MQGDNTPASSLRVIATVLLVLLITLSMSINVYACDYESCTDLPLDITDCPICLYENWDEELKTYTQELCEENGFRYSLVLAIIWNESKFRSDAIGRFGGYDCSYGLMQVEYVCFDYLQDNIGIESLDDLLDPKTNISSGIELLKYHAKSVTTEANMLLRYQVGEGRYQELLNSGIYTTTTQQKVLKISEIYEEHLS